MSFQVAVILWVPEHLLARPTAIDPLLSGPAKTSSVGLASLQFSEAVIGGGWLGSFGGAADGAVARQNGTSTWSNQSFGVGGPGGDLDLERRSGGSILLYSQAVQEGKHDVSNDDRDLRQWHGRQD